MRRFSAKRWGQLTVSLVLLTVFFLKIGFFDTFRHIGALPWQRATAAAVLFVFSIWFNSLKWRLLVPEVSAADLTRINFIGLFYGLVLPGQLFGEGAKGYYLFKNRGDAGQAAASIFVDKITGLIGLLILALAGVLFSRYGVSRQFTGIFSIAALACMGCLFALRIPAFFSSASSALDKLGRSWKVLRPLSTQSMQILGDWRAYLHRPGLISASVLMGVLFQLLCVLTTMTLAGGLGVRLPLADWCWIFGIVSVALLVPVTVGGVGLREGAFVVLLGYCGIAQDRALALSLSVFALQALGALLGGILNFRWASAKNGPPASD